MKTNTTAIIEVEMYLNGIDFIHFSKDQETADRAWEHFSSELASRGISAPRELLAPQARFMACKLYGAAVLHVPVVVFEDFEALDRTARDEAMLIPAPVDGHQPLIIKTLW